MLKLRTLGRRSISQNLQNVGSLSSKLSLGGAHDVRMPASEKRDLILSILRASATKRNARQYISRYGAPRMIRESNERFVRDLLRDSKEVDKIVSVDELTARIALIKIRDTKWSLGRDEELLESTCLFFCKLMKFGITPVAIFDCPDFNPREEYMKIRNQRGTVPSSSISFGDSEKSIIEQFNIFAERLERSRKAIDDSLQVMPVRGMIEFDGFNINDQSQTLEFHGVNVSLPSLLTTCLSRKNCIPVILPFAYNVTTCEETIMSANDIVISLCEHFGKQNNSGSNTLQVLIDKIVFVDPLGGIPSVERSSSAHVYVNLCQEYNDILSELHIGFVTPEERDIHLDNLKTMNICLSALPMSAAGIITTPELAAVNDSSNPIIHNLLTDRPVISSSLPVEKKNAKISTTIVRYGMPVQIFSSESGLNLFDAEKTQGLNLQKLWDVIEDSFGRKLDVDHYLKRVNNNVAAIIVAGDYDGAAIITWEDLGDRKVAYLDKIAVSQNSQGSLGVADIIFKVMAMQLFKDELIWRSRKTNPVNNWYFERCKGSLAIPESTWRMFWWGKNSSRGAKDVIAYERVCRSITPSWKT